MNLSISEQATLNFYEWEYLGRGYYFFNSAVDIEPPFKPFYLKEHDNDYAIDDGKVTLKSIVSNIFKTKEVEQETDELPVIPKSLSPNRILKAFTISFGNEQEISSIISSEFLNMLSYTDDVISFEIIANNESINVQIACEIEDEERIKSLLKAYFPSVRIKDIDVYELGFTTDREIAIADFAYNEEYMRPINTVQNFNIDPLTSVIASMENLQKNEIVLLQIIFKGITAPWANSITNSVSDGQGGSFFSDSPEMLNCARDKVSSPLFSTIIRIATQGNSNQRSRILAQDISRSISNVSKSQFNQLIPLSNEEYEYEHHVYNVYERRSNRLGMIMNSDELVSFVHYPNRTIVSHKLHPQSGKTKLLPQICINQKYILGNNSHEGIEKKVSINDDIYSKHIVVAGSTGTGKTHLLKQLIYQDLEHRNATFIIDPHGDLSIDILTNIKEEHKDNVIFINVADNEYSFGFNIFSAKTDAEKITLASDLASAFSDSWISSGDRINSVLQKTISTFLYSDKEASILDMKRFLLEKDFRNEFLENLDDPILIYYWKNEFPLVRRNELSPLLLRIDSFMQTRLLRNMFAQKRGIDFSEAVEQGKTIIIQLSVGLIGLENSKFIAKLLIAKVNQIAFARQSLNISERKPLHFYIDEAHIYANSPSIEQILSGARKYSLSLILVLQHLEQVQSQILNSILTNTATQIYFRQSEKDSRRVASGFSFFEIDDFMELDLGEAIVKVNKRSNDFNLKTLPLKQVVSETEAENIKSYIIQKSQQEYALNKDEINEIIKSFVPKSFKTKQKEEVKTKEEAVEKKITKVPEEKIIEPEIKKEAIVETSKENFEKQGSENIDFEKSKQEYLKREEKKQTIIKHRSIQNYIKTIAIQHGYKAVIEEKTKDGGRVDVGLTKNKIRIAVEVSDTNTKDYELKNIQKCLDANYTYIYMVSESEVHLKNIKKFSLMNIEKKHHKKIHFFRPKDIIEYLNKLKPKEKNTEKRILGYRVTTDYEDDTSSLGISKQDEIAKIIIDSMRKKK